MNATQSLKNLAQSVKIDNQYGQTKIAWDDMDDWHRNAHGYRVTLRYQGRQMSLDYFMGSAHTSEPDAAGVLDNLLSDASSADQTFEEWCGDYGYDTDSRKAEKTYKQVQAQTKNLRRLLGDDFDTFLNAERD